MPGTVHYILVETSRLLDAPARLRYRPGRLVVRAHEIAAPLIPLLNSAGDDILEQYDHSETPEDVPVLGCQFHRVRRVAGGRLVAAEVQDGIAHIEVQRKLMGREVAAALTALGTNVGRYLRHR